MCAASTWDLEKDDLKEWLGGSCGGVCEVGLGMMSESLQVGRRPLGLGGSWVPGDTLSQAHRIAERKRERGQGWGRASPGGYENRGGMGSVSSINDATQVEGSLRVT